MMKVYSSSIVSLGRATNVTAVHTFKSIRLPKDGHYMVILDV